VTLFLMIVASPRPCQASGGKEQPTKRAISARLPRSSFGYRRHSWRVQNGSNQTKKLGQAS
jgi:hypothetical protein